jgi:hypothetical protein
VDEHGPFLEDVFIGSGIVTVTLIVSIVMSFSVLIASVLIVTLVRAGFCGGGSS